MSGSVLTVSTEVRNLAYIDARTESPACYSITDKKERVLDRNKKHEHTKNDYERFFIWKCT
jgi:hypothetical protein